MQAYSKERISQQKPGVEKCLGETRRERVSKVGSVGDVSGGNLSTIFISFPGVSS